MADPGDRRVGAASLTLIKVADKRLGSTEEVPAEEGLTAVYSSRVRTLVDDVASDFKPPPDPRGGFGEEDLERVDLIRRRTSLPSFRLFPLSRLLPLLDPDRLLSADLRESLAFLVEPLL